MYKDNLFRMAGTAAVTCLAMAGFGATADAAQVLTAVTTSQEITVDGNTAD